MVVILSTIITADDIMKETEKLYKRKKRRFKIVG